MSYVVVPEVFYMSWWFMRVFLFHVMAVHVFFMTMAVHVFHVFLHVMVVHVCSWHGCSCFFMLWLFMFFHVMVAHAFFMSWWFMFPKAPGFKNWMMLAVFLSQLCLGLVGLVFF